MQCGPFSICTVLNLFPVFSDKSEGDMELLMELPESFVNAQCCLQSIEESLFYETIAVADLNVILHEPQFMELITVCPHIFEHPKAKISAKMKSLRKDIEDYERKVTLLSFLVQKCRLYLTKEGQGS